MSKLLMQRVTWRGMALIGFESVLILSAVLLGTYLAPGRAPVPAGRGAPGAQGSADRRRLPDVSLLRRSLQLPHRRRSAGVVRSHAAIARRDVPGSRRSVLLAAGAHYRARRVHDRGDAGDCLRGRLACVVPVVLQTGRTARTSAAGRHEPCGHESREGAPGASRSRC